MRLFPILATLASAVVLRGAETAPRLPIDTQVTHGFATNNGGVSRTIKPPWQEHGWNGDFTGSTHASRASVPAANEVH
jgi:hypothetical protein